MLQPSPAGKLWPTLYTLPPRRGLHRVVAAFWLSVFAFRASLFLTRSHYSFLPFWRCHDNETSAATALETINLRKCTQLFVNRTFNCIPDVCAQATPLIAFLKQDRSWGHTPPTKSRSARSVASHAKALSKNSEQANWKLHSSEIEIGGDHTLLKIWCWHNTFRGVNSYVI